MQAFLSSFHIPLHAVIGGVMIGAAAIGLSLSLGRIAGISGIFFASLATDVGYWRRTFIIGIPLGAGITCLLWPTFNEVSRPSPGLLLLIVSGLLVGWGTRLGSGCTSGHGVCGLGRLSMRSLAAVGSFMLSGILCATFVRKLLGVAL